MSVCELDAQHIHHTTANLHKYVVGVHLTKKQQPSRSFSVWTPDLQRAWDSGDDFESVTAKVLPEWFNSSHDENVKDGRSRSKGPEPEGITLGRIATRDYAFVSFERMGGVAVYDVTNPQVPAFVTYVNPRDFTQNPFSGDTDSGPEGVVFINAEG